MLTKIDDLFRVDFDRAKWAKKGRNYLQLFYANSAEGEICKNWGKGVEIKKSPLYLQGALFTIMQHYGKSMIAT